MTKQSKESCPVCFAGHLTRRVRRVTSMYRGHTLTYLQPGEWCDSCGEGLLTGADTAAVRDRLARWREDVNQKEARTLGAIRKRLRLTQGEAADIAGGGKNAFSRYERGQAQPVRAVSVLFGLLDRHPDLLPEAQEIAMP